MKNIFFSINDILNHIRTSSKIISIVLLQLLITSVNIYIIHTTLNTIEKDASIINESGIIRGSIQRISKLEINRVNTDNLIKEIDNSINYFLLVKVDDAYFSENIKVLNNEWINLKKIIYEHRSNPSSVLKDEIFNQSEITWYIANECVSLMQDISEYKLAGFNKIYIIFLIDFFLIGFTIWVYYLGFILFHKNEIRK